MAETTTQPIQATNPIKPVQSPPGANQVQTPQPAQEPYPQVALVQKVCPNAPLRNIQANLLYVLKAMAAEGLTSKNQLIGIIATIVTETPFAAIDEYGDAAYFTSNYEGRSDLGNTQKGDGARFHGRGFIQLTGRSNYSLLSKYMGTDLTAHPEVLKNPENSAKALVWYWTGKNGGNNPAKAAESGSWEAVRRAVNGGTNGLSEFLAGVDRGLKYFTKGLDPKEIGVAPLPGGYGLGCIDTGGAGDRSVSGVQNPVSQNDALSMALGLHSLDRNKSHEAHLWVDPGAQGDLLQLDVQKQFTLKGIGEGLDGDYTAEEVFFFFEDHLEIECHGFKPDPEAPPVQVFRHDTSSDTSNTSTASTTPIPAGDIPGKILAAAKGNKGKSTSNGPGGGNVACAFAVNKFGVTAAGLKNIGQADPAYGICVYVPNVVAGLEGGRGQKISRAQAVAGDIWIANGMEHIGICTAAGCATVLSNSSSRASFAWEDSIGSVNGYYGGSEHGIYRVTS